MTIFESLARKTSEMDFYGWCGFLSFVVLIIGYVVYDAHTWVKARRNEPVSKKATWVIFTFVDLILAWIAQTDYQMWSYVGGASSMALLTCWYGERGWSKDDKRVFFLAIASAASVFVVNKNVGAVMAVIAIGFGTWPLIPVLWNQPRAEPWYAWVIVQVAQTFGVAKLFRYGHNPLEWPIDQAAGPVGFFVLCAVILGVMFRPNRPRPQAALLTRSITRSYSDGSWDEALSRNGEPHGELHVDSLSALLEQSRR